MILAKWWETLENGKLRCTLCPRYCTLGEGQSGFCFIRENIGGKLFSLGYGHPAGFAVDPIEKKPLFHFLPGTTILSFGTAGCNLGCRFCQNWTMTKSRIDGQNSVNATPDEVIAIAKKYKTPSIAFTYNEPVIFGEYIIDISSLARQERIKTVMVTNGYIDKTARKDVYKNIDAANVDLKAFSENFYHRLTYSHLENVLNTIKWLKDETGVWIELTNLLIPGENDSPLETRAMCGWILKNLGDEVPVHFSAFHPDYKMTAYPGTPPSALIKARQTAICEGIKYVYTGNIYNPEGQTTFCPQCKTILLKRDWNSISINNLQGTDCPNCHYQISGIFK
jgi:pyruvate formate lyase activating enzyme